MVGEDGDHLRKLGNEFGATTGRARRCGWFDVPILRSAKRLNGLTSIALTRLDTLDTMERLKVCTSYEYRGERLDQFPSDLEILADCQPIYEEIEGWRSPTAHIRSYRQLPSLARDYVELLVEKIGLPASLISVGPERDATIEMD
jgi:adenylosuccinate synthase